MGRLALARGSSLQWALLCPSSECAPHRGGQAAGRTEAIPPWVPRGQRSREQRRLPSGCQPGPSPACRLAPPWVCFPTPRLPSACGPAPDWAPVRGDVDGAPACRLRCLQGVVLLEAAGPGTEGGWLWARPAALEQNLNPPGASRVLRKTHLPAQGARTRFLNTPQLGLQRRVPRRAPGSAWTLICTLSAPGMPTGGSFSSLPRGRGCSSEAGLGVWGQELQGKGHHPL